METTSLLKQFITTKIKEYRAVEPTRKDTPKGHAIGPMAPKYEAAALCLLNTKLKHIAEILVLSYSMVRDWATEPIFKQLIQDLADEFADVFWKTAKEYLREYDECVTAGNYDNRPSYLDYFGDPRTYGVVTKKAIFSKVPTDISAIYRLSILDLLVDSKSKNKQDREWSLRMTEYRKTLAKQQYKLCMDIMKKPVLSDADRFCVISYLSTTEPK